MELAIAIFGIVLGLVSLAVAYWQYRDAQNAKAELSAYMRSLPDQVLNNVTEYLKGQQGEALEFYDLQESGKIFHTRIVDIDGDGEDELLVQYPFGLHNAALRVFGIKDHEFRMLDEIDVDTMAGFIVEDVDHDGKLEVKTLEVSPAANQPYVCGFRDEVLFRFNNGKFDEVGRRHLYSEKDLNDFLGQGAVDGQEEP
jgi:cbb3-type cytochrome oxidase subunit 3